MVSFPFISLDTLDFTACLCVANTIRHESLSFGIAEYILENKKISAENMPLVQHLGENVLDKLLQADISSEEKILLLIAWFNASTEKNDSQPHLRKLLGDLLEISIAPTWIQSS